MVLERTPKFTKRIVQLNPAFFSVWGNFFCQFMVTAVL